MSAVTLRPVTLRLGSRKSPMAIAQSRQVADMITERTGRQVEIVGVTTLGDVSRAQLTQIGGTGVFVSALRDALLGGEVDLAVHSLKDLPTADREGLVIAVVQAGDRAIASKAAHVLEVPPCADFLAPLLTVIPLQLLAYHIAVRRGCDVDQPRNLAKSVTVE